MTQQKLVSGSNKLIINYNEFLNMIYPHFACSTNLSLLQNGQIIVREGVIEGHLGGPCDHLRDGHAVRLLIQSRVALVCVVW